MSKLQSLKGIEREIFYSNKIHNNGLPLLVSAKLLRRRNCGQIDIAVLSIIKGKLRDLFLFEVKSSQKVGLKQYRRLLNSRILLSKILKINTFFKVI